jgi:hypothetical protein
VFAIIITSFSAAVFSVPPAAESGCRSLSKGERYLSIIMPIDRSRKAAAETAMHLCIPFFDRLLCLSAQLDFIIA